MPTITTLMKDYGLDTTVSEDDRSTEDKLVITNLQALLPTEIKAFVTQKSTLTSNISKLWGLLWGQCTPSLQQDLRNLSMFEPMHDQRNYLWLLQEFKKALLVLTTHNMKSSLSYTHSEPFLLFANAILNPYRT